MKITRRDILLGAGAGLVTTAATGMARAQSQGHDMSQMKEPAAPPDKQPAQSSPPG